MKGVAMQPGEEIENLVSELEQVVRDAKSPFAGGADKKIVDAREIFEIIEDIRSIFPEEFTNARRILREQDEIIERAQVQAESIISAAQSQAMLLASDQEVTRIAKQEAQQIRDAAQQYERDTRYNAEEYADTVLAHLEDNIKSLTNSVSRVRQTLSEKSAGRKSQGRTDW
jgi:cell division septum initiation protein DivIVA